MTYLVMETTQAHNLQGRRVTGSIHRPAPDRIQQCGPYGRTVTLAAAVSSGVYHWPTRCGREGVVYVRCALFRGVERCAECAA